MLFLTSFRMCSSRLDLRLGHFKAFIAVSLLGVLITIIILIIYMKKFLDCDWLRGMQFLGNTVQKKVIECRKEVI